MKYSIFLLMMVAAFSLPISLSAAPKGKKGTIPEDVPKTFSPREQAWLRGALSEKMLLERINIIAKEILQNKDLHISKLKLDIQELKNYEKYYFLEHDSGISRRWIKQNIDFAEALLKTKAMMNRLILNKQTGSDEYRQWYEYYGKTARQYKAIVQKPLKATNKRKLAELAKIKKAVIARELAAEQQNSTNLDEKNLKKSKSGKIRK